MGRISITRPFRLAFMDRFKTISSSFISSSGSFKFASALIPSRTSMRLSTQGVQLRRSGPLVGSQQNVNDRNELSANLCSSQSMLMHGGFGIRPFSTEVSIPTIPSQQLEPLRVRRTMKKSEDRVLHQAQHHNFPRAKALRKRFKGSTRKLKLVCKLVRRARVDAALMQLSLSPKRLARVVRQCIYDAKFNAANNHGKLSNYFDWIVCTTEVVASHAAYFYTRERPSALFAIVHPIFLPGRLHNSLAQA